MAKHIHHPRRTLPAAITAFATAALVTPPADGAAFLWTGAADLEWNNPANWNPSSATPGSAASHTGVFINVAAGSAITVNASPGFALRGVSIGDGTNLTNNFTLSGAPLTFNGAVELSDGTTASAQGNRVVFQVQGNGGAATYAINNDVTLNSPNANTPRLVVGGANKSATFNGVIANTGTNKGFAKDGAGTLRLNNTGNSYTGVTDVLQGTLLLGGDAGATGVLGAATSTINVGAGLTGTQNASLLTAGGFTVSRDVAVPANANTGTAVTLGGNGAADSFFTGNVTIDRVTQFASAGSAVTEFSGIISGSGALLLSGRRRRRR